AARRRRQRIAALPSEYAARTSRCRSSPFDWRRSSDVGRDEAQLRGFSEKPPSLTRARQHGSGVKPPRFGRNRRWMTASATRGDCPAPNGRDSQILPAVALPATTAPRFVATTAFGWERRLSGRAGGPLPPRAA